MADKKDAKAKAEEELKADKPDGAVEGEVALTGGLSKKKKIIIGVVALLLVLGGGAAAAYFTGMLDSLLGKNLNCLEIAEGDKHYEDCQKQLAEQGLLTKPSEFFEIPNLIVNLNSTSKQPRFLKISIKLELESTSDVKKIENVMPRVVDHFQTYLRELRVEDLRGSSGIYRLRIELLSRVKAAAPDVKVKDILFQEILIQ